MILRRPYALLIKYFKVIHLFICVMIGYLIYKTSHVLNFFNSYAGTVESVVGQSTLKSLLNGVSIILPLFIVLLSGLILYLMRYKKKPVVFYVFNIISYIFVTAVFYYTNGVLNNMYIQVVDIRVALLVRDLITGVMIIEWITLLVSIVRATGFDIKKFNFGQDLEELDVDAKDREEFEINIEVDTDKLKRGWNRYLRHAKYIYKENKILINAIASVTIVILLGFTYYQIGIKNRVYSESEVFTGNGFTMQIKGSYITDKSGNGNLIDKKNVYVLVPMTVKNNYATNRKFDITRPVLVVNGKKYYNNVNVAESVSEFGDTYYGESLDKEQKTYLLIYKVPKKETLGKMKFEYIDEGDKEGTFKTTKFQLEPTDLTGTKEEKTVSLKETLNLKDTIFNGSTLKINEIQIEEKFKLNYNFCITTSECISSSEYLTPTVDEYYKYIMKVNGTFKLGKNSKVKSLNLAKLIEKYGKLVYTVDGKEKTSTTTLKEVKPKRSNLKDEGYVEVLSEVKDASKIELKLTIYNTTYTYRLK